MGVHPPLLYPHRLTYVPFPSSPPPTPPSGSFAFNNVALDPCPFLPPPRPRRTPQFAFNNVAPDDVIEFHVYDHNRWVVAKTGGQQGLKLLES